MLVGSFDTMICSLSDHDKLVAEIYYNGLFVALVSQERGEGLFDIETPGLTLVESLVIRKVDVDGFIKAVEVACRRLKGE